MVSQLDVKLEHLGTLSGDLLSLCNGNVQRHT